MIVDKQTCLRNLAVADGAREDSRDALPMSQDELVLFDTLQGKSSEAVKMAEIHCEKRISQILQGIEETEFEADDVLSRLADDLRPESDVASLAYNRAFVTHARRILESSSAPPDLGPAVALRKPTDQLIYSLDPPERLPGLCASDDYATVVWKSAATSALREPQPLGKQQAAMLKMLVEAFHKGQGHVSHSDLLARAGMNGPEQTVRGAWRYHPFWQALILSNVPLKGTCSLALSRQIPA